MTSPMPRSPYSFLQEELRDDPWKMLVACIMLNLTSFKQVRPVIWSFFEKYPNADILSAVDVDELAEFLTPLGMQHRRARTLIRFSQEWSSTEWSEPRELHGIGQYGQDSWDIFIRGDLAVHPRDKKLKMYIEWAQNRV